MQRCQALRGCTRLAPHLLAVLVLVHLQQAALLPIKEEWFFRTLPLDAAGPTTMRKEGEDLKVYHNLWYHNTRYYGVTEDLGALPNATQLEGQFSLNQGMISLPVRSARTYYSNLMAGWVRGNTLLVDFPFHAYPDNMGHWAEVLLPVYSQLSGPAWRRLVAGGSHHLDTLLIMNLRRAQLQGLAWVWEMMRLALAPALAPGAELPTLLYYDELEALDKRAWLGFQNAIVVNDRYTRRDGKSGFSTPELGQAFRATAYERHNVSKPPGWDEGRAPRTITLLSAAAGEAVHNRDDLAAALADLGGALGLRARPYTVTAAAPFASYVAAMARTGVLVTRHGPLLANAIFLPPGAVVLEMLPYNWEWRGISEIYFNITRSLGDLHHFAWRARAPRWAAYADANEARYADWTVEECSSRECLEVHARAGMLADVATIQETLYDVLPPAMRGANVASLARPWPRGFVATGKTGLWWDK